MPKYVIVDSPKVETEAEPTVYVNLAKDQNGHIVLLAGNSPDMVFPHAVLGYGGILYLCSVCPEDYVKGLQYATNGEIRTR